MRTRLEPDFIALSADREVKTPFSHFTLPMSQAVQLLPAGVRVGKENLERLHGKNLQLPPLQTIPAVSHCVPPLSQGREDGLLQLVPASVKHAPLLQIARLSAVKQLRPLSQAVPPLPQGMAFKLTHLF